MRRKLFLGFFLLLPVVLLIPGVYREGFKNRNFAKRKPEILARRQPAPKQCLCLHRCDAGGSKDRDVLEAKTDFRITSGIAHQLWIRGLYGISALTFLSVSVVALTVCGFAMTVPWFTIFGKEVLLLSCLWSTTGWHFLTQAMKGLPPSSYDSWNLNRTALSEMPVSSVEGEGLLRFLERRWLAKANGFVAPMIHWYYPCYGIHLQVHPDTTASYSRNPSIGLSKTYIKLIEVWRGHFPLILTRPFSINSYLPHYIDLKSIEELKAILKTHPSQTFTLDCTTLLKNNRLVLCDLAEVCKECGFPPHHLICIQRVEHEGVGGIRLLPLKGCRPKEIQVQEQFLLERLGRFGVSANYIELDRALSSFSNSVHKTSSKTVPVPTMPKCWDSPCAQHHVMVKATVQLLQGLFSSLPKERWEKALECPTHRAVIHFSLSNIREKLQSLKPTLSYFEISCCLNEIHSHISALLEILRPYESQDFAAIYRQRLALPERLREWTSCTLHVSGMTAFGGIIKAIEHATCRPPRILYGENTYFECIEAAKNLGCTKSIEEASDYEIQEADLILVQFNPVLRKGELFVDEYRTEKIKEVLQKCLAVRKGKPLTVALDSTSDFIYSSREHQLLSAFVDEIEKGALNIISYRSGVKFDLFGMDNYCGAPLYMIHNKDPCWDGFKDLLTNPLLQTDLLSVNWFCLAYQHTAQELDLYRKQIFDNTRNLLKNIAQRFLDIGVPYRVVPCANDVDPTFVEIRVEGFLHQIKAPMLVGASLLVHCLQNKQPIFNRASFGFDHPNFTIIFGKKCSQVRLTLGLDPQEIEPLTQAIHSLPSRKY